MRTHSRNVGGRGLVLLLLVVVGIGLGVWWAVHRADQRDAVHETGADPSLSAMPQPAPAAPTGELLTPAAAVERVAEPALALPSDTPRVAPESYTRELGGLHGRLVELDGTPVPAKKVELIEFHMELLLSSLENGFADVPPDLARLDVATDVSAADGTFSLKGAQVGAIHVLGADLGGPRALARLLDISLERGGDVDLGDVILTPGVTFTGTVLDDGGEPIAGARVRVVPELPWPIPTQLFDVGIPDVRRDSAAILAVTEAEMKLRMVLDLPPLFQQILDRLPLPTTQTATDGTFSLPGVPAGIVTLLADAPRHLGVVKAGLPTGKRPEQKLQTIVLSSGRTVSGRAVIGKEPLAHAEIYVGTALPLPIPDETARVALAQPAGTTDGDGRFSLDGLPLNGDVLCAVRLGKNEPWTVFGPFEKDDVTLELPPRAQLGIAVADGNGKPVENAEFRFTRADIPSFGPERLFLRPFAAKESTKSTAPGQYLVTGLPVAKWQVSARAPGYGVGQSEIELIEAGATTIVTLPPLRNLRVQVVDAATRLPLEYALVSAYGNEEDFLGGAVAVARTEANGIAELRQLPAGDNLRIQATHPGHAVNGVRAGVVSDAGTIVEIALFGGGDLSGQVTCKGEPPAKPVMLVLSHRGSANDNAIEANFPRFAVTNLDGTFRIRHLTPGKWQWTVFPRFFAASPLALVQSAITEPDQLANGDAEIIEAQETKLAIEAEPEGAVDPATVRGSIRVDGAPAAKARVRLNGRKHISVEAGDDGRFEFQNVKPGRYMVSVDSEEGKSLGNSQFEVGAGEVRDLLLDLHPTIVTIRVTERGGQPISGATVQAMRLPDPNVAQNGYFSGNDWGECNEQGVGTLSLSPGRWRVHAESPDFGKANQTVEISDGARTFECDITLDAGVLFSGIVVFDGAASAQDAATQLWISFSPVRAGENTNGFDFGDDTNEMHEGDTHFELKHFTPGRYRANIFGRRQMWSSDEFEVGLGGLTNFTVHVHEGRN